MWKVPEVYIQSLCDEKQCLWPTTLFENMKKIYLFDAGHIFDKQSFMAYIHSDQFVIIPAPSDPRFIKGIYNRDKGIALFSETLLAAEQFPKAQTIPLKSEKRASKEDSMVVYLREKATSALELSKEKLTLAKTINNDTRILRDSALSACHINEFIDELIQHIFYDKLEKDHMPGEESLYFGPNTECGPLYTPYFYKGIEQLFILKGKGTTITSKILERIREAARKKGFNTIKYFCPFYTSELDGLVIPSLKVALLDGNPPHEIEPLHPSEIVLPLWEKCHNPEVLYSHTVELRELEAKYKQYMRQAMLLLQDYSKFKRQELAQFNYYQNWPISKLMELLNDGA